MLTIAELAIELNISSRQAYNLVGSGDLPAIRVGAQWRVERDVLEQ